MRKELYLAIIEATKRANVDIRHYSLWNNNLKELEKEGNFDLPGVFIEFDPIRWKQGGQGCKTASITIKIHIVIATIADASDGSRYQYDALQVFDVVDGVVAALSGAGGECFNRLQHVESITDHNHDDIHHYIEHFTCELTDNRALARKQYTTVERVQIVAKKSPTPS